MIRFNFVLILPERSGAIEERREKEGILTGVGAQENNERSEIQRED